MDELGRVGWNLVGVGSVDSVNMDGDNVLSWNHCKPQNSWLGVSVLSSGVNFIKIVSFITDDEVK